MFCVIYTAFAALAASLLAFLRFLARSRLYSFFSSGVMFLILLYFPLGTMSQVQSFPRSSGSGAADLNQILPLFTAAIVEPHRTILNFFLTKLNFASIWSPTIERTR